MKINYVVKYFHYLYVASYLYVYVLLYLWLSLCLFYDMYGQLMSQSRRKPHEVSQKKLLA
jgi:hypothetical protein